MKIKFNDLMTYIKCPMLYLIENMYGIKSPDPKDELEDAIKQVIFHYYFKLLDGKVVDENVLKSKWESIWFDGVKISDVLLEQDSKIKMGYQGWNMISEFFKSNYSNPGRPLVINDSFEIPVGDHIVTGSIDLVRECNEGYRKWIDIVHFTASNYTPEEWELRNNFYTTLQSYAFRTQFQTKEQKLTIYSLKKNKPVETSRDEEQFKRLESLVNIVATSIQSNFYYPRPTFFCKNCKSNETCEQWGIT